MGCARDTEETPSPLPLPPPACHLFSAATKERTNPLPYLHLHAISLVPRHKRDEQPLPLPPPACHLFRAATKERTSPLPLPPPACHLFSAATTQAAEAIGPR